LRKGIRDAGISKIERKLSTGTVTDLVTISDGVTGRIIEVLRRAAFQGLADKLGLQQLQHVGARMPSVIDRSFAIPKFLPGSGH
jgi:hypothetical protein